MCSSKLQDQNRYPFLKVTLQKTEEEEEKEEEGKEEEEEKRKRCPRVRFFS